MNQEKQATCFDCGHPLKFIQIVRNAYFDDWHKYDYAEHWCAWCKEIKRFGFPPVYDDDI